MVASPTRLTSPVHSVTATPPCEVSESDHGIDRMDRGPARVPPRSLIPALPMAGGIGQRLFFATRVGHSKVAEHAAIKALDVPGKRVSVYAQMVVDKAHVYRTLESLIASRRDPSLREYHDPSLLRASRLGRDIAALTRRLGRVPEPSEAARDYVAYLETIREEPHRLAVHAWLNYLGDMFGGQAIAARVRPEVGGTAGLSFDSPVGQLVGPAMMWIDAVVAEGADETQLIAEGQVVYKRSIAMHDAWAQAGAPRASGVAWKLAAAGAIITLFGAWAITQRAKAM